MSPFLSAWGQRLYNIRRFIAVLIMCCLASLSFAQDITHQETTPVIAHSDLAQTEGATALDSSGEPAARIASPDISERLNGVEITETIREKTQAIEEAEAELLKAIRDQMATQAVDDPSRVAIEDNPASLKKGVVLDPEVLKAHGKKILDTLIGWLTSPAFLGQVGAIILALFLAPMAAKHLRAVIFFLRDAPQKDEKLFIIRHYVYEARELLRPALNIGFLALFAVILKSTLGQDWLVKLAQGLAVVFLLYNAIKQFAPNDLIKKLATWILIPMALLIVFGRFDDLLQFLDSIALGSGDNPISALTIIKLGLFGAAFFWLGNFSNEKGQTAIRSQESLDSGIREIISKFLQIVIFAAAAIMALSAAGIGLGGLVVIFSAMSLGIGLGLQPIAANFVSGLIILFDRTVRVGDFLVLPDGQEGFVEAINMRSTTVETTDGKDIMVPNTTFTESTYENWTHKDPRQRYEVYFAVEYNTDIDQLEEILIPAISAHPSVLQEPEEPDLELREFGEYGIHFAIEFWCSGIDDGPNKFTSDLNFIVWRTLKQQGIKMPLPQREIRMLPEKAPASKAKASKKAKVSKASSRAS